MKQDIICTAPLTEDALSAAVADFFRTVRPERERLYLMPPRKADPLDDITYQKIRLLRDDAKGKG